MKFSFLRKWNLVLFEVLTAVSFSLLFLFGIAVQKETRQPFGENIWEPISQLTLFEVQSVDTMKYSRDVARQKLYDPSFDADIAFYTKSAAELGATHIALGTPYEKEFAPFLRRWVEAARKEGLSVWFRGNLAGWEGWFGYKGITPKEHQESIYDFILQHPDLFRDGDVFTPCPECENGALGDPRFSGTVPDFRQFLIDEHAIAKEAFRTIAREVEVGYHSMNGDVAALVMDKETTAHLGGVAAIDHYVKDAERFAFDVASLAEQSGGRVAVSEFGLPIADIHGNLEEEEQAEMVERLLQELYRQKESIAGVNYWVLAGGSTALLDENGRKREAFEKVAQYYKPVIVRGIIRDPFGNPLEGIPVVVGEHLFEVQTDSEGKYQFAVPRIHVEIEAGGENHGKATYAIMPDAPYLVEWNMVLEPVDPSLIYSARVWWHVMF